MTTREAAVAGLFYPAKGRELATDIDTMLAAAPLADKTARPPKVVVVPHAGYIYSGPVAAAVYRQLAPHADGYRRVVLLGPAHRVNLEGLALPEADRFATPLGDVAVESDSAARLARLDQVFVSDAAHRQEHSLEVQLPFLKRILGGFEIVPLVVGRAAPEAVAEVIDAAWGGPETLIVISSDLSHYLPYDRARRIDAETCRRISDGRADLSGEQACGASVLNGLARSSHRRELVTTLVDLRTSGDTAGPQDSVVGYAGFVFH